MQWDNRNDAAWNRGLEAARRYREQFGSLMVPKNYKSDSGFALGQWIVNTRQSRAEGKLSQERTRQLDELGMSWNALDSRWEQGYALAAQYAAEYKDLNVPADYVTPTGEALGKWLRNQCRAYTNGSLSPDQVARLEAIGMYWGNRNDRQWNEVYQAAKRYFEANGNLDVPVAYVSPEGYTLGKWVRRQQYARQNPEKSSAVLSPERIALLDAIGMQWEKSDSWQHRLKLAQEYKRIHGTAQIPAAYKTSDGIWLGRWMYQQKKLLQSGSEKLSAEQKEQLKGLLEDYVKISA